MASRLDATLLDNGAAPPLLPNGAMDHTDAETRLGGEIIANRVSHSVPVGWRNKKKQILRDVTCHFPAGDFAAILGPSGAGKTTLLSLLRHGRASQGELLLDGRRYSRGNARRSVVTVPQDDVLLAGLTAYEMLMYGAELRLDASAEVRAARVRAVLGSLHFTEEEMNTLIGSVDDRGLSGGQRKRVSIGLELLTSPRVLLCDEPTSGLDAKLAFDVVRLLQELSARGHTVLATIHQPSWRIMSLFSSLLMLDRGAVAYQDSVDAAMGYFDSLGFPPLPYENPADHWMVLLQDQEQSRGVDFLQAWESRATAAAAAANGTASAPAAAAAAGEEAAPNGASRSSTSSTKGSAPRRFVSVNGFVSLSEFSYAASPSKRGSGAYAVGQCSQAATLLRRALWDSFKDTSKFARLCVLKLMVGLLIGVVWLNDGRNPSYTSIFPTTGAMFIVVNNSSLDVLLETVLRFPLSRALLRREYLNSYYSLPAYFASLVGSNLIVCCVNALLLALPVYALVGFQFLWDRFCIFCALLMLMSLIGGGLGIVVGCFCKDVQSAKGVIIPTLAPLLIFSGYVIPYKSIPSYFEWAYYSSFFAYSFSLLQINELRGRVYTEDCPVQLVEQAIEELVRRPATLGPTHSEDSALRTPPC